MQGGRRTFVKPDPVVQVLELPCGVWRGQVLRGYVGDRSSKPVFKGRTPFDILGPGYQRPFELATLRLSNMIGILPRCGQPPLPPCLPDLCSADLCAPCVYLVACQTVPAHAQGVSCAQSRLLC